MTVIVPSYIEKVSRAKKHIIDLEDAIAAYTATKPYTVRERVEGKKKRKVYRLAFAADPANTDIPIIAADAIYNLRSCLDHLMGALVPTSRRRSVMFPVFFQGVWEPAVPGEDQQRLKDRSRWTSCIKSLPAEAVAFLKQAQPPDRSGDELQANLLQTVNRWSNRDRHEKLPVIAPGLRGMMLRFRQADGTLQHGIAVPAEADGIFKDQTTIRGIPDGAMDVEVAGVPVIAIGVGTTKRNVGTRYLEIPEHLSLTVRLIEEEIIPKLSPYVLANAG